MGQYAPLTCKHLEMVTVTCILWNLINVYQMDSMLMCVYSVIDHKWRQNGNVESICSIQWSEKKKDRYTHLPHTAWPFEDLCYFRHFLSPRQYFSSLLLLFSLILLAKSFFKTFFNIFTGSKQNNGENILQSSVSLVAMTHCDNGNCCEVFSTFLAV